MERSEVSLNKITWLIVEGLILQSGSPVGGPSYGRNDSEENPREMNATTTFGG